MKPQIGQRWRFVNPGIQNNYVAEIICLKPLAGRVVQVILSNKYRVGDQVLPNTLTLDGPRIGFWNETWTFLEGQDK